MLGKTLKPYQGLKLATLAAGGDVDRSLAPQKPYQGLKEQYLQ